MNETVEYREIMGQPGFRIGSDGSVWKGDRRIKSCKNQYGYDYVTFKEGTGRGETSNACSQIPNQRQHRLWNQNRPNMVLAHWRHQAISSRQAS